MLGDSRGRLTVPDVVFFLMTFAFMGALYPVFRSGFEERAAEMTTGAQYLYLLILPVAILVIFSVIFVTATGGRT